MHKLWTIFIFGLIATQVSCMNIRAKRQIDIDAVNPRRLVASSSRIPNPQPTTLKPEPTTPTPQPTTPKPQPKPQTASTTVASTTVESVALALKQCMWDCPSTPEYNPVCGSDGVRYDNRGRLDCANSCGANITMVKKAPC